MDVDNPSPDQTGRDAAMRQAQKIARDAPDSRDEQVAAAKRALQDGTLMLDANRLADILLADPLHQADSDGYNPSLQQDISGDAVTGRARRLMPPKRRH